MATTVNVQFTNYFDDDTKATITLSDVGTLSSAQVGGLVQKVTAFNADPSEYQTLMSSKYGAQWRGISQVKISETEKTYIF